ncbi:MAG: transporter [Ignavibacteriaceae bacterium]
MKKIIVLLFAFSSLIFSQEPIITDRPDVTESAVTVPHYSLQVESGFVIRNTKDEENDVAANFRDVSFLTTLLRYGLMENLELRLGSEYLYQKVDIDGRSNAEGLNGLLAGAKFQLVRDNPSFPDMALLFHLNIPFGSENFKTDNIEPEILLALSHPLSKTFSLSYNLGGALQSSNRMIYFYSVSVAAPLSEKLGAFIELFGEIPAGNESVENIDGGFTYLIQDNFQFDISAGVILDQPSDNWFLSTGISFRF